MTGRPTRRLAPWRAALSFIGIGFAVGALTLAAAQGQFSGGSRRWAASRAPGTEAGRMRREPALQPDPRSAAAAESVATSGSVITGAVEALRARGLDVPVEGVARAQVPDTFHQSRGSRLHEAVDILAPRNTPVHAVEDGRIARLFFSQLGGITIYQFDPTEQFCYYYAHLERYAPGLTEGQTVRRGDVLGYVGTSGNAPKNTPHLHFAIFKLGDEKKWWDGDPIDPFLVYKP